MICLDIIVIMVAAITIILTWRIYRITKASPVLCIWIAMFLGFANRILLIYNWPYVKYLSVAFWVLWAIGLYLLLKVLQKYIPK
jgi:hypothetical protein